MARKNRGLGYAYYGNMGFCNRCEKEKIIVDSYTPFGRPGDMEPPDSVELCADCVEEEIKTWVSLDMMPEHWLRADYETGLAEILGFELRHEGWGGSRARWYPKEGRLKE